MIKINATILFIICIVIQSMVDASQVPSVSLQKKLTWGEKKLLNEAQTSTLTEKRLEKFIRHGVNINIQNKHGWTALMYVARHGQADLVKALISAGADPNIQSNGGWTALMWATYWGHAAVVKVLMEADADPTLQNNEGLRASDLSQRVNLEQEKMKAASAEIRKDTEWIVQREKKRAATQKMLKAVQAGDLKAVEDALQDGADVNVVVMSKDGYMSSFLVEAVYKRYENIANVLIRAGADINVQDSSGKTPLMWAAAKGQINIINKLINAGAHLNNQSETGWTALTWAAYSGNKETIIALLQANADPYIMSFDAQAIRDILLKRGCQCSEIESNITYAEKTFDSILQEKYPMLLQDSEIQKALADYDEREKKEKQRKEYSRKIVAPEITESIKEMHFPRDLSNIVAEYAVEQVPIVEKEVNEAEEQKKTAACCIIV